MIGRVRVDGNYPKTAVGYSDGEAFDALAASNFRLRFNAALMLVALIKRDHVSPTAFQNIGFCAFALNVRLRINSP